MLNVTITVVADNFHAAAEAATEATRLLRAGNLLGFNSNEESFFRLDVEGEEEGTADDVE